MVTKEEKYLRWFISLSLMVIIVDQLLKFLVVRFRPDWDFKILLIHFISNTGAGFGILQDKTLILAIVSLVVVLLIVFFYKKIPQDKWVQVLMGLFLGGVVGNFIDRMFRGYVIDFIDFKFWPAFNIADAMITSSVIGLVIYLWKE
ncbi:signal peptidase II [Candidatus Woesearchaeota archaeon]|nr:signal peptidase II [Candidatus Woesearchaeota archaeon]